jgi:hypothetical protein
MGLFVVLIALIPENGLSGREYRRRGDCGVAGFFLHEHFTIFHDRRHHIGRKFMLYVVLFASNMALSSTRVYLPVGRLVFPTLPSGLLVDVPQRPFHLSSVANSYFVRNRKPPCRTNRRPIVRF